ncbi:hypothetical protein E2C01_040032 [Portunus trituberculatus]|uniref:Uncharacterized protein n=1 Tax=Portunus trituberculatus TaxID=210409 RepID=A0A5B7FLL9_PORTR|nr:hypothetical protein [Portunus trituberculatus]
MKPDAGSLLTASRALGPTRGCSRVKRKHRWSQLAFLQDAATHHLLAKCAPDAPTPPHALTTSRGTLV